MIISAPRLYYCTIYAYYNDRAETKGHQSYYEISSKVAGDAASARTSAFRDGRHSPSVSGILMSTDAVFGDTRSSTSRRLHSLTYIIRDICTGVI